MSGDDPQHDASNPPNIPVFFTSEDLPSWLRPETDAQQPPPETRRETRARIAWADTHVTHDPARQTPFRTAADATWDLLTPPPRHAKRGRRASGIH